MTTKNHLIKISLIVCLSASALAVSAAVPNVVNYRGRLVDASGSPVADGPYLVKFIIYDAATGGAGLWNSNFQSVTTTGGLFEYQLGENISLPLNLVTENANLYLGITIGTDPEISPRTAFTSGMYSYYSRMADSSLGSANASKLGGQPPSHYLDWSQMTNIPAGIADGVDNVDTDWTHLTNVPAGFADGVDDNSGGDITGVTAGAGLSGGGAAGAVSLSLSPTIAQAETFTNTVRLNGTTHFGDSTMRIDNNGITIGSSLDYSDQSYFTLLKDYNSPNFRFGLRAFSNNSGAGKIYSLYGSAGSNGSAQGSGSMYGVLGVAGNGGGTGPVGPAYGVYGSATNRPTSSSSRFGLYGDAGWNGHTAGASFGVYGNANCGSGATAYGLYGRANGTGIRYAGYFSGSVHVTGTLSKGAGAFKIDHPLDPSNKYLQHSFVESPDMKNIYDGNVTTDANGEATVTLPEYFETLNRTFRYQLTAIGAPGPNLYIADEISGNTFRLAGAKPGMKVSWQVTGIRQDAYANAHRIEVEIDKPAKEKGLYMHPVEHGLSETLQLHYEQNKKAQGPPEDNRLK